MILLIDNYDSFVFNLARYIEELGYETLVMRNDAISSEEAIKLGPDSIILSPGPCSPAEAGVSIDLVHESVGRIPMLGVCLGHQAIASALGAKVVRSDRPRHGRASFIHHDGLNELAGLPNPFKAGRYHSLLVDEASLPAKLTVSARTDDGDVMAIRHRDHPVVGWQFHPESILTEHGSALLAAFLRSAIHPDRSPGSARVDHSHRLMLPPQKDVSTANILPGKADDGPHATSTCSRSEQP